MKFQQITQFHSKSAFQSNDLLAAFLSKIAVLGRSRPRPGPGRPHPQRSRPVEPDSVRSLYRFWIRLKSVKIPYRPRKYFSCVPTKYRQKSGLCLVFLHFLDQGSRDGLRPPLSGVRLRPLFRNFPRPTSEFVLEADDRAPSAVRFRPLSNFF